MNIWQVANELTSLSKSPIEEILQNRGQNVEVFMNPSIDQLHSPLLMKGMKDGVERIKKAIQNNEKARIAGDYDADGISSTYTMMDLLQEVNLDVSYEIPDRKDGYGLSRKMVDNAYRDGCSLIITCDNGIAAVDAVEYAKSLGIDVIVTDHHEPQDKIPDCIVINPKQKDCPYPFKELAGCAVAWKFCQAVLDELHPAGWLESLRVLEIVATGTIADVMDLVGENRVIVHYGLERYKDTNIIGLQELLKALEIDMKKFQASTIGYTIGPALNATGRLVSASEAVEMLLEKSRLKAMRSARYLADLNAERKAWSTRFVGEITEQLMPSYEDGSLPSIVVYDHPAIPEGIVGIIASKLKETFNRPILLMTSDESGTFLKGSGRSIKEYNLFDNLMRHRDLFMGVGGHHMACGFSLPSYNRNVLAELLNEESQLTEEDLTPKLHIDYDIEPHLVSLKLAEEIDKMKPFGKGNPKPLFRLTNLQVKGYKYIGSEAQHLKLQLFAAGYEFEAIGFSMADKYRDIVASIHSEKGNSEPIWLDVAFRPGINEWNNRRTLQLELEDIKLHD